MSTPPARPADARSVARAALAKARSAWASASPEDARGSLATALRSDPRLADAWLLLAMIEHAQGRPRQALDALDRAVDCSDGHPVALANRAAIRLALGDHAGAAADARRALSRDAASFMAWFNLGRAEEGLGHQHAACDAYARARAIRPRDADAARALAQCLQDGGHDPESVPVLRALLAQVPDDAEARLRLANALANTCCPEQADAEYGELLARHPSFAQAHSTWLIHQQTRPGASPESLLEAHLDWARRHAPPTLPSFRAAAAPRRRLRIGWISPRFAEGPVATFFLPVLQAMRGGLAEHWLFPCQPVAGSAASAFQAIANRWVPLWEQDEHAAAETLRSARLDVLVDLGGHAPGHRLRALAARCAPVQVSWLDYFCTTGIEAMDWLLTDAWLSPAGSDAFFVERLARLPHGRLCYAPPDHAPHPGAGGGAGLVLACFNRLNKLHPELLATWAALLKQLPAARLRLKSAAFDANGGRAYWGGLLQAHGIPSAQLELLGRSSHRDTLASYRDVDVALDTFPFSGCATSADALWMGVPVVTRAGATMASRQTAALLAPLGLEALVAADANGYVERVLALADDAARRRAMRASLPEAMRAEHQVPRFAGSLQDVLDRVARSR